MSLKLQKDQKKKNLSVIIISSYCAIFLLKVHKLYVISYNNIIIILLENARHDCNVAKFPLHVYHRSIDSNL